VRYVAYHEYLNK